MIWCAFAPTANACYALGCKALCMQAVSFKVHQAVDHLLGALYGTLCRPSRAPDAPHDAMQFCLRLLWQEAGSSRLIAFEGADVAARWQSALATALSAVRAGPPHAPRASSGSGAEDGRHRTTTESDPDSAALSGAISAPVGALKRRDRVAPQPQHQHPPPQATAQPPLPRAVSGPPGASANGAAAIPGQISPSTESSWSHMSAPQGVSADQLGGGIAAQPVPARQAAATAGTALSPGSPVRRTVVSLAGADAAAGGTTSPFARGSAGPSVRRPRGSTLDAPLQPTLSVRLCGCKLRVPPLTECEHRHVPCAVKQSCCEPVPCALSCSGVSSAVGHRRTYSRQASRQLQNVCSNGPQRSGPCAGDTVGAGARREHGGRRRHRRGAPLPPLALRRRRAHLHRLPAAHSRTQQQRRWQ